MLPSPSGKASLSMLELLNWWPCHWHYLLTHILDLSGNVFGGCGLFTAWLPDRRVSESAWTTDGSYCQMLQTHFDLSMQHEVL